MSFSKRIIGRKQVGTLFLGILLAVALLSEAAAQTCPPPAVDTLEAGPIMIMRPRNDDGTVVPIFQNGIRNLGPGYNVISRIFFDRHPELIDKVDYLLIINAFPYASPHYWSLRRPMDGIGNTPGDVTKAFNCAGSSMQLQGIVHFDVDATGIFTDGAPPDPQFNQPHVIGHEVSHDWLAYVRLNNQNQVDALSTREYGSHWGHHHQVESVFSTPSNRLRSTNSCCGVAADLGAGSFSTSPNRAGWSPLDLYLMGFRPESQVPNSFYIKNPSVTFDKFGEASVRNEAVQGEHVDITIAQIKQAVADAASNPAGVRIPDVALAQKNFRIAFILLIDPLTPTNTNLGATDAQIRMAQLSAASWPAYFKTYTETNGTMLIDINPGVNNAPVANAGLDQVGVNGATITLDGSYSADPEGGALSFSWLQTGGPAISVVGPTTTRPTLTGTVSNSAPQTLTFRLTVTDGAGQSATDDVQVTLAPSPPAGTLSFIIDKSGDAIANSLNANTPDADVVSANVSQPSAGIWKFSVTTLGPIPASMPAGQPLLYEFGMDVDQNTATGTGYPVLGTDYRIDIRIESTITGTLFNSSGQVIQSGLPVTVTGNTASVQVSQSVTGNDSLFEWSYSTESYRASGYSSDGNGAPNRRGLVNQTGKTPPTARAGYSRTIRPNTATQFDGSTSTATGATIVSHVWNFGDGTPLVTGAVVSHSYPAAGTYTVTLTVFDSNGLDANNAVTAYVESLPDLTMTALSATPASLTAGGPIQVTGTVFNQGDAAAQSSSPSHQFLISYYLSTDAALSPEDIEIPYPDVRFVNPLPPNTSNGPVTQTITIPRYVRTGSYYLLAVADGQLGGDTAVVESNETNNVRATLSTIAITGPSETTPPSAVILSVANRSATAVDLTWTASTDASQIRNYFVERSSDNVTFKKLAVTDPGTLWYLDTAPPSGTTFYYRVQAVDHAGNVSTSAVAGRVTATVVKSGTGRGTVTAPSGINCGATCSASFPLGSPVTLSSTADPGSISAGFSGGCVSGGSSCTFTPTANATVTAAFNDTQAPTAPSGLTATAVSDSQINLAWTASTDNVGVTQYRVERCLGAACTTFTQIGVVNGAPPVTNFQSSGLTAGTTYRHRVRAADAGSNAGGFSAIVDATTLPATWRPILRKGENGALNYRLQIMPGNNATFDFDRTVGGQAILTSTVPLTGGVWNHLAVTFDGTTVRMYINGVLNTSVASGGVPKISSAQALTLGRDIDQAQWMKGNLDEVRIYNVALTAAQIGNDMVSQSIQLGTNLKAYYKLDETSGTTAGDSSGNGRTGTNTAAGFVIPARLGNGYSFNGSSSFVNVPNHASLQLGGAMTLEAWVFLN